MTVPHSNVLVARRRLTGGEVMRGLISLRDRPEFEGAFDEKDMWIRVNCSLAKDAVCMLALVPGAELFYLDDRQRLTPIHRSVPVGLLPSGLEWNPIHQWTRLWLPTILRSKGDKDRPTVFSPPVRVDLKWTHSEHFVAPGGLLCDFADWSSYVLNNIHSKWRLLRFACRTNSASLNTLVIGEPIPSIPGVRLVNCDQVLTPIAFMWVPAVPAQAIRRSLRVSASDWILWEREPSLEILLDRDLIAATRVSIRATAIALAEAKANAVTERSWP